MLNNSQDNTQNEPCESAQTEQTAPCKIAQNDQTEPCGKKNKNVIKSCVALALAVLLLVASIAAVLLRSGEAEEGSDFQSQWTSSDIEYSSEPSDAFAEYSDEISEYSEISQELFPEIDAVLPENCTAAGIYEANSLYCIFAENADSQLSLASITKLITASVALKYMPTDTVITVGSELNLVKPDSSTCGLKQGYVLTLEQLLYGLLMSSGNDAAYTVAVNVARYASDDEDLTDREAVKYFCTLMNELAAEIGANNSSFANPEGWDDENNYSTVADIALIAQYAKGIELIAEIASTDKYTVNIASGEEMNFSNSNFLLHEEGRFYHPSVTGLKTGSTSGAGKCLAATVNINGFEYIAIVMGCPDEESRYSSMLTLISYIEEYNTEKFA